MNSQVPARTTSRAVTPFEALKIQLSKPERLGRLKELGVDPQRFVSVLLNQVFRSEKLMKSTPQSLISSMYKAAECGMECDGVMGHLVPFNNKQTDGSWKMEAQFIPGYQGYIHAGYNHPRITKIWGGVVHERDYFSYECGLNEHLVHRPSDDEDAGELTHAWAAYEIDGRSKTFVVLPKRKVMSIKSKSHAAKSGASPWNQGGTAEESMWLKTAIRQLAKIMPKSKELQNAIIQDAAVDPIEVYASVETPQDQDEPEQLDVTPREHGQSRQYPLNQEEERKYAPRREKPEIKKRATPENPVEPEGREQAQIEDDDIPFGDESPAEPEQTKFDPVEELSGKVKALGVTEEDFLAFVGSKSRAFKGVKSIRALNETGPKKVQSMLADWPSTVKEIGEFMS